MRALATENVDSDRHEILVLGYSEAAMYLRQVGADEIQAIVAIHGQREHPIEVPSGVPSLILQFDDSQAPDEEDPLDHARFRLRKREAAAVGLSLDPPNEGHARSIIEFARQIQSLPGTLICQCAAGISRSPAAALLCLAAWLGPGQESACVQQVLAIRPAAQPHRDLVRFGDRILGRGGRLLEALNHVLP